MAPAGCCCRAIARVRDELGEVDTQDPAQVGAALHEWFARTL
ncbi:hypothetical protein ABGB14_42935 [Nonomuraea sp. B10E15]